MEPMFWSQAPGKDFGANVFGARPQEKISEPIVLEPGPPGKGIGASGFGARLPGKGIGANRKGI